MAVKKIVYQPWSASQLPEELARVSRLANQRMATLEKAKLKTFAYGIAQNDIRQRRGLTKKAAKNKKLRFSTTGKKKVKGKWVDMTFSEMQQEYARALKFINSESSTISGMQEYVENRTGTFGEMFDVKGLGKQQLNRIYKVISGSTYQHLLELNVLPSDQIIDTIVEASRSKLTIKEINAILEEFAASGSDDWAELDQKFTHAALDKATRKK